MGCITGLVAKTFLIAFNVIVAVSGLIVLTLAALIQSTTNQYGHDIPQEANDVLIGLESSASFVICLGALGVVVSCCCGNKLFLYTYFILGAILVGMTLTFASMGTANINNGHYRSEIQKNMQNDVDNYDITANPPTDFEKNVDQIYQDNQCCGLNTASDWNSRYVAGTYAPGCCIDYKAGVPCKPTADMDPTQMYVMGCWPTLFDDVSAQADATVKFAIFFGVLLFGLITSTCLCVKCTDAMPI